MSDPVKGSGALPSRATLSPHTAPAGRAVRLQVVSDFHVDVRHVPMPGPAPDVDVVVVAGDVRRGAEASFRTVRDAFPIPVPVVMVLGNHEFYRGSHVGTLAEARERAPAHGITFLEDDVAVIAGVRFVGATLWTDYALDGEDRRVAAMTAARRSLNDHRHVTLDDATRRPWTPETALAVHVRSRAFLKAALVVPFDGPTVVVTHHAPHPGSVHPRYAGDVVNACFASDLTALILAGRPDLWVHGHVHDSFDYRVGSTRTVCNAHGYGGENPAFDPNLVVEVVR